MRSLFQISSLSLLILILSYGCQSDSEKNPPQEVANQADTIIKGNFIASRLKFDSLAIDEFLRKYPALNVFAEEYAKFYTINKHSYVWYEGDRLSESASYLINQIAVQRDHGILKDIPYKKEFSGMIENIQFGEEEKMFTTVELMLTGQYFNYAKNVWGGAEAEKASDIGWFLPRKKLSYVDLLEHSLKNNRDSIEHITVVPQYRLLKEALIRYQQMEKSEQDILLPSRKQLFSLSPGDTSVLIIQLKNRLRQLGDWTGDSTNSYDTLLVDAVKHFKNRHGLTLDSKINSAFLIQLNTPVHERISQIIVNLERMRWMPAAEYGDEFLLINIPEFKLHYYINNQPDWACNVVVGKAMTKTVIFSGQLEYIVFSPYWNVPPSILQNEIIPGMAKDSNYLAKHQMEWNGGKVRQLPGKKNSLGLIKFIFPNTNNIYLHDTPSKSLFNEDVRAFSHGCIRVAQPKELAERLLKQNLKWTPQKIEAAMQAGKEQTVNLKRKIPVYIGYFTAFIDDQGVLNFRDDIYQRDERLLKMLIEN